MCLARKARTTCFVYACVILHEQLRLTPVRQETVAQRLNVNLGAVSTSWCIRILLRDDEVAPPRSTLFIQPYRTLDYARRPTTKRKLRDHPVILFLVVATLVHALYPFGLSTDLKTRPACGTSSSVGTFRRTKLFAADIGYAMSLNLPVQRRLARQLRRRAIKGHDLCHFGQLRVLDPRSRACFSKHQFLLVT